MFKKPPPKGVFSLKFAKKFLGVAIALEVVTLAVSFYGFQRIHGSSDTRYYLMKNFPKILEGYYLATDKFGGHNIRNQDLTAWARSKEVWEEKCLLEDSSS